MSWMETRERARGGTIVTGVDKLPEKQGFGRETAAARRWLRAPLRDYLRRA